MNDPFGTINKDAYHFEPSRKEKLVASAEDWSAAILSGSDTSSKIEDPIKADFLRVLIVVSLAVVMLLVGQMFNLQIINGRHNQLLADGNRIRARTIAAPRGIIYDRNHELIVQNLANFDAIVIPSLLSRNGDERKKVYDHAASILGANADDIAKKAESKGINTSVPVIVAEKIERDRALLLDEQSRYLAGFVLNTSPSREYMNAGGLSHFLGYIGRVSPDDLKKHSDYLPTDVIGKGGIEASYEQQLRGTNGQEQTEVEASGKPVRLLASVDPQPGNNLILSIDKNLQNKTEQTLKDNIEKAGAHAGIALAMNPKTGEILAAANYPNYDNNLFAKGIGNSDYQSLLNNPDKPLFNRIAAGSYPIGSTIKPLISAAALQEGVITPATTVVDKGKIEVPNIYNPSIVQVFKGWKLEGLGVVNVVRAIAWSSDIFFYTIGGGYQGFRGMGVSRLVNYFGKFGFGKKTGIDIAGETPGFVPTPENKLARTKESWSVGDTYNISIGQGSLLVSPMQLAVATSAIANGGTLYKPHIVKSVMNPDGKQIEEIKPMVLSSNFISPENIALVKQGMKETVASGTACCSIKQQVPVIVAGKTGTAETSTQDAQGKSATKPHAWFTSFAPADDPQICTVVLVEYSGEGAEYAVPITREILKAFFIH